MASEKILAQKQAQVEALKQKIECSVAGVLVDYSGISVADDTKLRKELREAGVNYFVVKNTLLERAAEMSGFGALKEHLSGATAMAVSEADQTAAARILAKYAEGSKGKFTIKVGYIDGAVVDAETVTAIGKLPNREGMLSMFAGALTGTLSGLAVAMQAYVDKTAEAEG